MKIGAYYYAWYHQKWLHQTVRTNDQPIRGEYDNTKYGQVILDQMIEMRAAGIDFISVSWNAKDYGHVLDAASETGMKVTYFYESLLHYDSSKFMVPFSSMDKILDDMEAIRDDMMEDCWLKIDGRPVLMFYVTRCYKENAAEMFDAIRKSIPNVYMVADEYFWEEVPDKRVRMFDALTSYNMYQKERLSGTSDEEICENYLSSCRQKMNEYSSQCRRLGKPLWGCAMPGYDDSGVRPEKKHPYISRLDGKFFKQSLLDAKNISDQVLMICSYSEWYEDTQIEPCSSYGSLYANMVKEFKANI